VASPPWLRDLPAIAGAALRATRDPARLRPGQRRRWKELTAWRVLTAGRRVLPDFVIAGTQRGGTTSLYRNLAEHPQVEPCIRKEVHFFDTYFERGPYWYRGHFPTQGQLRRRERREGHRVITGEATPAYLFDPVSRVRMAALLPGARWIVVLREPVARAYSQYQVRVSRYGERRSFEEMLQQDPILRAPDPARLMRRRESVFVTSRGAPDLARGLYVYQLEHLLELHPRERVLILGFEEMLADEEAFYRTVTDFLGIAPFPSGGLVAQRPPPYPPLEPETRRRLEAFYRPHNERLFALLGRRLPWARGAGRAEAAARPG